MEQKEDRILCPQVQLVTGHVLKLLELGGIG